jgi:hypothetical protein
MLKPGNWALNSSWIADIFLLLLIMIFIFLIFSDNFLLIVYFIKAEPVAERDDFILQIVDALQQVSYSLNALQVDVQFVIETDKFLQLLKLAGINEPCFLNCGDFNQSRLFQGTDE